MKTSEWGQECFKVLNFQISEVVMKFKIQRKRTTMNKDSKYSDIFNCDNSIKT